MKLILKNSSLLFQKYEPVGNLVDKGTIYEHKFINNADSSSAALTNNTQWDVVEVDVSAFPVGTVFYTWCDSQGASASYGRNYAFFSENDEWTHGSTSYLSQNVHATKTDAGDAILRISFLSDATSFYVGREPYSGT